MIGLIVLTVFIGILSVCLGTHLDKIEKKLDHLQGDVNEYLNTRGE